LSGGPDWLATERFDIEAVTDRPATKEQMTLMLRSLLAERFKLKMHRETRELRVYALTVGKNGPKLTRAKEDEREALMQRPKEGPGRTGEELVVQKTSIARFTEYLSRQLDQPVIDRTGLQGDFSFTLNWVPDVNPPVERIDAFGPAGIAAIEETLGLKLESVRSDIGIWVVDAVERTPTPN
jgi:uncharacterized protein (TIGR03435 family)